MVKYSWVFAVISLWTTLLAHAETNNPSKIDIRLKSLPLNRREVVKFINPVLEFSLRSSLEIDSPAQREAVIRRFDALSKLVSLIPDKENAAVASECIEAIKKNVSDQKAVEETHAEVAHLALDMVILDFIGDGKPEAKLKALRSYFEQLYSTALPDDRPALDKAFP